MINRSFKADIKTLFEMWVNPEHFGKWMGPAGSTMAFISPSVKEGESSLWSMTTADGHIMHGKMNYITIHPYDLLVYTQSFCDKDGKIMKPSFCLTYPDTVQTTVSFAEEASDETRVTVKWEVAGEATDTERQTFHDMKSGMTGGWSGSFDKLDSSLEAMQQ
ncbi:MAG: SRPBCC domain-containing protein [Candidatus Methylacidiphilales bacterium]